MKKFKRSLIGWMMAHKITKKVKFRVLAIDKPDWDANEEEQ